MEENGKLQEDLIGKSKAGLDQEKENFRKENMIRQEMEMQLSQSKSSFCILQEDAEALIDIVREIADKQKKKILALREYCDGMRNENFKTTVMTILKQSGLKHDISG